MFRKIEEAKVAYWQVLLTISAVIFVRIILEYALEAQKRVEEPTSLFLFFTYFWSVIAGLMLLVWWLSGKELLKVAKVVAAFSPLLWLPPFADLALSEGRGFNLTYMFDPQGFMDALLNFCAACRGSSPGLQVEIVATLIVAAAYVFWASRSLFRATACAAAVYVFILFGAFFPGALMTGLGHAFQDVYLYREIVSSYALFLTFSVLLFMRAHKAWPHIAERFRIERSMHYAGWALFGAFVGFRGWQHPLPGALLPLGALAASIFFAFEAAAWINDYFDKETDKYNTRKNKIATALRKHEKEFVAVFLGLLLLNGLAAGYAALAWVAFAFCLSLVYSSPPLRLRRHFVLSSVVLAACATAVFLAGYGLGLLQPEKTPLLVPLSYVVMVFGFVFLAAPFKDLKDAEADRKAGIFTLPSWLGLEKARKVTAALMLSGVAWVVAISGAPAWIAGALAGTAAWFILKEKNIQRMELFVFVLEYLFAAAVALWVTGMWPPV